jgi:aminopeptidase N
MRPHAPTHRFLPFRALCLPLLALATAASGASAPAPATAREVLPGTVVPSHYALEIRPEATQMRFSGEVRIALQVRATTATLLLNAAELEIDAASVDGQPVASSRLLPALERLELTLARPVAAGAHELRIAYRGVIRGHAQGLFALDFDVAGSHRRALFTQFEAADARRFLPCWDEPGLKATYALTAVVPAGDMAVSNMPVAGTAPAGDGLVRVRFQETPRMSSYLLFFASGDFERVHRTVEGVDVGVVVPRGLAAKAGYALDTAAQVLPYYNDYFGVRYPLPKLDLVAGPGSNAFFGAMENWGAIFSFQDALLVDPKLATEGDRRDVYITTAHEMAHQWFGDLVTMQWWDGIWLNEGFASWMENKAAGHFHPEWSLWSEELGSAQRAMAVDAARGTHAVITDIPDVAAANEAFDVITYQKGGAVIRMLERSAGEDVFRDGVRRYMRGYAYGNSVTDGLWRALEAAGAKGITQVAHAYTLHAGIPLVTVGDAGCSGGRQQLRLVPARFAIDDSGAAGGQWPVPLQLRSLASGDVVRVTVQPGKTLQASVRGCGAVLANAGQSTYVRIDYAGAARDALLARYAALPPEDQLGTFHDTQALALVGKLPLASHLQLVARLPADADPMIWDAVPAALIRLDEAFAGEPVQPAWRARARALLAPVAANLGWTPRAGEGGNAALARASILDLLGRLQDPGVVGEARARFGRWLAQPDSLDAGQRDVVLSVAATNADVATWERLRQLARDCQDPQEAQQYWQLLGYAADDALAGRALELALTDQAPRTYRSHIVAAVARLHPVLATRFAIDHWDALGALLDDASRSGYVAQLASRSAEPETASALAAYAGAHVPPTARGTVDKSLARIGANQRLRARGAELLAWVRS